ncbi:MAG: hypothetical protein ABR606_13140 [Vicinamibacterales bacterium]
MRSRTTLIAVLPALMVLSAPVHAQVIGSFSWQMQPFCNVVTLRVIQQGGLYQLIGTDNLCGGAAAPVTGTAAPAGGAVALGFTVALVSGSAVQVSATINPITFSGSWFDSDGNTGTFLFGGNTGGSPRPVISLLTRAVTGGNGEGVGGSICTGMTGGVEVFVKNGLGNLVDARFSFIIPGYANGQIRGEGSIRTGTPNLTSVQHPAPGSYCLVFSNPQPTQVQAESTVVSIHAER